MILNEKAGWIGNFVNDNNDLLKRSNILNRTPYPFMLTPDYLVIEMILIGEAVDLNLTELIYSDINLYLKVQVQEEF